MTAALKPCPFCGGEAHREELVDELISFVGCKSCNLEGPCRDNNADAIAAWNRRADDGDWTDLQARAPSAKPGNHVDVEAAPERGTYRFLAYKPDGARQMGRPGRWQIATEHGWKNAPLPTHGRWKPNPPVTSGAAP